MHILIRSSLTAAVVGFVLVATPAVAEVLSYNATLSAVEEVPSTDARGTGSVAATYDTASKLFSWTVEYEDLTGSATAAHFHGPAGPGEIAAPVIPIEGDLASPVAGEATLTDQQAADLKAGTWYFNVHTAQYPDGELRGQITLGNPD